MKRLTKKQKAFADDYLESGEPTEAALKNYNIGGKGGKKDEKGKRLTAASIACENLKNIDIQLYLEEHAGGAVTRIEQLSRTARNETVKLNANKDLLDRAGYKPVDRTDITTGGKPLPILGGLSLQNDDIHEDNSHNQDSESKEED